jgi:hypothetical protein
MHAYFREGPGLPLLGTGSGNAETADCYLEDGSLERH